MMTFHIGDYPVTCSNRNDSRPNLDLVTEWKAFELINSEKSGSGPEAAKLIDAAGGVFLTPELARNAINPGPALTIEGLLQVIKKAGEIRCLSFVDEKYADELSNCYSKNAAAMFKINWELASTTARAVLQSLSFLGPEPVPRRLLRDVLDHHLECLSDELLDQAIGELADKLFLIELDEDSDPRLNRPISACVRKTIDAPGNLSEIVARAVVAEMARAADESDVHAYEQLEKILPHAELLVSYETIKTEHAIDLANYLCIHNWKRERFRVAEKHGRKAAEITRKHFQPGHPRIATSQSNLGEVLRNLGKLEEARELLRAALESDEKNYEPGHPIIAIRQSVLALVLQDLGAFEEARILLRKALESDERTFDPGHPKIATRQLNLAAVLHDLGELEEARDLAKQAYRSFLAKLGPEHPYTEIAKRNWESI